MSLNGAAVRSTIKKALIPVARAFIRHAPTGHGKRGVWERLVGPYLSWAPYLFKARTTFGAVVSGDTQDIIQRYIYYFGVWEPQLTRFLARRLSSGDTFVDVGANIGYFALLASKMVGPSGAVVAIEASPSICRVLDGNMRANNAANVRTVQCAAAAESGKLSLYLGPEDNIGGTSVNASVTEGARFECEVPARRVFDILDPDERRRARVVKVDVEGAEWDVIRGLEIADPSWSRNVEFVVEVGAERLDREGMGTGGAVVEEMFRLFIDAGFFPYGLENRYSAEDYLPPTETRPPRRLRLPPTVQMDVVFSRRDAEVL